MSAPQVGHLVAGRGPRRVSHSLRTRRASLFASCSSALQVIACRVWSLCQISWAGESRPSLRGSMPLSSPRAQGPVPRRRTTLPFRSIPMILWRVVFGLGLQVSPGLSVRLSSPVSIYYRFRFETWLLLCPRISPCIFLQLH